jgi:hypothetical protein
MSIDLWINDQTKTKGGLRGAFFFVETSQVFTTAGSQPLAAFEPIKSKGLASLEKRYLICKSTARSAVSQFSVFAR